MKSLFNIFLCFVLAFPLGSTAAANELQQDPVNTPLALDIAFEQFVSLQEVADALRAEDTSRLIELAISMAEAERILLRVHRSGVKSSEILIKATQLAATRLDQDLLGRLSAIAEKANDTELVSQIKAASKFSGGSRDLQPMQSVSLDGFDVERLIDLKEQMGFVDSLQRAGDKDSLVAFRDSIDGTGQLSDAHNTLLKAKIDRALNTVQKSASDGLLARLTSTGRGWDPRKTIGEIAEGDIVGAISGVDFRIPQNETVFTGKSGRKWIMIYTLKNDTPYQISVEFVRSGNTSAIAPGKTITCRSRASSLGSEKTGAKYTYPQVRAKASNGTTWLRTISRDGEDYRIIKRADGTIQIVP